MNTIFKGAVGFVVGYMLLMLPTYVLPYFGSNSAIVGAIGATVGRGFTPQFWLHAWCLAMLVLVTSIRGNNIAKGWVVIFPVLAGFFDLVPVLNLIPLVPTVMHLLALVLGAMASVAISGDIENSQAPSVKRFSWEPWAAGLMSLSAISGTFHFISGVKATAKQVAVPSAPASVSPKAKFERAQGVDNTTSQSASLPAESATRNKAASATALADQTSIPLLPKPQVKKPPHQDEVRRASEPKKVEEKPTIRYIDINK